MRTGPALAAPSPLCSVLPSPAPAPPGCSLCQHCCGAHLVLPPASPVMLFPEGLSIVWVSADRSGQSPLKPSHSTTYPPLGGMCTAHTETLFLLVCLFVFFIYSLLYPTANHSAWLMVSAYEIFVEGKKEEREEAGGSRSPGCSPGDCANHVC